MKENRFHNGPTHILPMIFEKFQGISCGISTNGLWSIGYLYAKNEAQSFLYTLEARNISKWIINTGVKRRKLIEGKFGGKDFPFFVGLVVSGKEILQEEFVLFVCSHELLPPNCHTKGGRWRF